MSIIEIRKSNVEIKNWYLANGFATSKLPAVRDVTTFGMKVIANSFGTKNIADFSRQYSFQLTY